MSGIFGEGIIPRNQTPPEPLPDYVAPARAFFGDDTATGAYLAQLEAYAADGAEATELLDAAEAAGTVSEAIALLEGGGVAATPRDRALAVCDAYPTGLLAMLYPITTGTSKIEDLTGGLADADWTDGTTGAITGFEQLGLRGSFQRVLSSAASAPFRVTGALSMHFVYYQGLTSAPGYAVVLTNGSATDADNYLWGFTIDAATISTFHEKAGGSNVVGNWTRPANTQWALLSITRSVSGRHIMYINGAPIVGFSATSGTVGPGGAYIDLDMPVGGGNSRLYFGKDQLSPAFSGDIALFGIWNTEHTPLEVAAIASILGYT